MNVNILTNRWADRPDKQEKIRLDKNVCSMAGDGSPSESSTNETREASDCLFSLPKGYKKDLLIHDRRRGILAQ